MRVRRRQLLASAGTVAGGLVAGCTGRIPSGSSRESQEIAVREVESSISAAVFRWGIDQGAWAERDISLSFETVPYGRYNRQLVTGEADIGAPATLAQLKFMADGEPLAFVGPQQNMFNRMFIPADDESITDPTDLAGGRVGVPAALSSTTTIVHRALIADEYGFDIINDTAETRAEDPPVLWELFKDGEFNAVSEFSGFTIRGMASADMKTIFDPHALWTERTGVGLPTTTFTVRRDWFEDNTDVVKRFLDGWAAALSSFRVETETALNEFGRAAGITDPAEAAVVRDLMADDVAFGPAFYDQSLADAHWGFFELLADRGAVSLPDRGSAFVTESAFDGD